MDTRYLLWAVGRDSYIFPSWANICHMSNSTFVSFPFPFLIWISPVNSFPHPLPPARVPHLSMSLCPGGQNSTILENHLQPPGSGLAGESPASWLRRFSLFEVGLPPGLAYWVSLKALHILEGHFYVLLCEKKIVIWCAVRVEGIILRRCSF